MPEATQQTIAGTFEDRDDELEGAALEFLQAQTKEKKAKDRRTTAYDTLKEYMRDKDLSVYHCYTLRKRIELQPEDAKVKVVDVKDDESTPYLASENGEAK